MLSKKQKIVAAGVIGNVIEYYDFALIGFLAVIMGQLFFPSSNAFLSLLGSFGAFAAGMIMRPLGALVFGHIGDRIGRRFALMTSLLLMALPTFLIGFLPTYTEIGIFAPLMLVVLRMIQGLSVGGEYASSIVYLVEQSTAERQNLYGSFVSVGAKIGMALGSGVCGILFWYFGEDIMAQWGWRIPFILSIFIAFAGIYLRRNLTESYHPKDEKHLPIVAIFKNYQNLFWKFLIIASSVWIVYYTIFVYLPIWLEINTQLNKVDIGQINTFSIILGVIFIPTMAFFADRTNSFIVMKIAAFSLTLSVYPIFLWMSSGEYLAVLLGTTILVILLCAFQAPIFAATVNAIDYHGYRASFTAIILGSAAGIVGGTTPALMTSLNALSHNAMIPAIVLTVTSLIGFLTLTKK